MAINKMDSASQWRFSKCSKSSNKMATTSKNYIHGISFLEKSLEEFQIRFSIAENVNHFLKFVEEPEGKVRIHYCWNQPMNGANGIVLVPREKWNVEETGDCKSIAIEHLKKYLKRFETNLKELSICSKNVSFDELNIQNMENLGSITIDYNDQKIDLIECGFVNFAQVSSATNYLYLPYTNISFDQLIQLKAKTIYIGVVNLTEENLLVFVDMWKAGNIGEKKYIWLWTKTEFSKILKLEKNVEK